MFCSAYSNACIIDWLTDKETHQDGSSSITGHNITCYAESGCGQENRCGQEGRCGEASTPMRYEISGIDSTWGQPGGSKRIAAPRLTVVIFLVLFILLTTRRLPAFLPVQCNQHTTHLLKHGQHAAKQALANQYTASSGAAGKRQMDNYCSQHAERRTGVQSRLKGSYAQCLAV